MWTLENGINKKRGSCLLISRKQVVSVRDDGKGTELETEVRNGSTT